MAHPLVLQLRFTRGELVRGIGDVSEEDAGKSVHSLNSISWVIGHLAWQEQRYWLYRAQGKTLFPELDDVAYGKPASTPSVRRMWEIWRAVTQAADPWLDTLTTESLQTPLAQGLSGAGTFLRRTTYHYWYHLGKATDVRKLLGHANLPVFVGDIDGLAPYMPE
jgi:hypothetical protein